MASVAGFAMVPSVHSGFLQLVPTSVKLKLWRELCIPSCSLGDLIRAHAGCALYHHSGSSLSTSCAARYTIATAHPSQHRRTQPHWILNEQPIFMLQPLVLLLDGDGQNAVGVWLAPSVLTPLTPIPLMAPPGAIQPKPPMSHSAKGGSVRLMQSSGDD